MQLRCKAKSWNGKWKNKSIHACPSKWDCLQPWFWGRGRNYVPHACISFGLQVSAAHPCKSLHRQMGLRYWCDVMLWAGGSYWGHSWVSIERRYCFLQISEVAFLLCFQATAWSLRKQVSWSSWMWSFFGEHTHPLLLDNYLKRAINIQPLATIWLGV